MDHPSDLGLAKKGKKRMPAQQTELERFRKDTAYYEAHREELLQQYPEQWAAIFDERVVGVASDVEHLLEKLKAKGIPPGKGLVEHLTRNDELLILCL